MLFRQLIFFLIIGGISTVLHISTAILANKFLGFGPQLANLTGFCSAVLVSYFGHAKLTFRVDPEHAFHLPRFIIVSLCSLAVSSAVTYIGDVILNISFVYTMLMVALSVPPISFLLLKFWVFVKGNGRTLQKSMLIGLALALMCSLVFLLGFWGRAINHDTAWYLIATRQWLEGAKLYTDIIEVNPPLNFYYTLPAILLADLTGMSDTNSQYCIIASLMAGTLFWSWRIVERSSPQSLLQRSLLLIGIAIAVTVPAVNTIGQREHIMCLFLLPWVIGLITSDEGDKGLGGAARGAFAALGICLKPFFLVFPLFIAIWLVIKSKSLKPVFSAANLAMGFIGLAYVIFVVLIHLEYFTKIIPLAQSVYGDYGITLSRMLDRLNVSLFSFAAFLIALGIYYRKFIPYQPIFAVLILAGLASYFVQWTSFRYHTLPIYIFSALYAVWLGLTKSDVALTRIAGVIVGIIIATVSLFMGPYSNPNAESLINVIAEKKTAPVIVSYSTYVSAGPLLALQLEGTWASHYPHLWSVPAIANARKDGICISGVERCDVLEKETNITRQNVLKDLHKWKPDVIIFDTQPGYIKDPSFSFQPFLMEDPEIAKELSSYKYFSTVAHYDIWMR